MKPDYDQLALNVYLESGQKLRCSLSVSTVLTPVFCSNLEVCTIAVTLNSN